MKPAVDIQLRGLARIQDDSNKIQELFKATNQESKITRERHNEDDNKHVFYNHKQKL